MRGTVQAKKDLGELLKKLVAGYGPQRVLLFGSYAYGEPDRHSDLDLLIVKETKKSLLVDGQIFSGHGITRIFTDKEQKSVFIRVVLCPYCLCVDYDQRLYSFVSQSGNLPFSAGWLV